MPNRRGSGLALAAAYLLGLFLAIYGPVVGQGFIADDFGWISATRPSFGQAVRHAFNQTGGFYRPFVSISFAVNHELSGLSARPYGLTNLALLVVCAVLVAWLGRLGGLGPGFSLLAAGLFAFNLHGVDMAVLWISGRTALFLTMFSLAAAVAFIKRRPVLAAGLTLCAMLSKEEAVVLPLVFCLWAALEAAGKEGPRRAMQTALTRTRWMWAAAVVYAALRLQSDAMLPSNAPAFYRFSDDPQLLLRNAMEYADRACTLSALVVAVVLALVRSRPLLTREQSIFLGRCACWLIGGFALTMFLPTRSSLYALFPSVGAALAASTLVSAWWPKLSVMQKRALVSAALVLPLALFPVYRARGDRWIAAARLSSSVTTQLVQVVSDPQTRAIVLQDDRSTRANLANAFGPAASDVASLFFSRPVTLRIEPSAVTTLSPGERLLVLDGPTGRLRPVVVE